MSAGEGERLLFSLRRIIILSVLSAGLYYLYWVYRTWKQLSVETPGAFYPVWHALAQLVPVYGQFRLHHHTSLIRSLAAGPTPETRLSPGAVVTLIVIALVAGFFSMGVANPVIVLFLIMANVVFSTAAIAWPQRALNGYWRASRGEGAREAPFAVGELFFLLVGLSVWVGLPRLF